MIVIKMLNEKISKSWSGITIFQRIVDVCCCSPGTTPMTDVFSQYGNPLQNARGKEVWPDWTEHEITQLKKQIEKFRATKRIVFGPCHLSCLRASKYHLLKHLVDALRHLASIAYLDIVLFESSHKQSKRSYTKTSMKWRTTMGEPMGRNALSRCVENACHNDTCFQVRKLLSKKRFLHKSTVLVSTRKCFY